MTQHLDDILDEGLKGKIMFRAVIIEDEKPILELMKVILGRNTNYTIVGAFTNPIEALEKMEDIKPDVAFIDVEMPKMNGLELARKVRALTIQTEIVFTTAYKNYALDAFGVEAIDYILKPVTPSTIERVTERLVNRQRVTTMVIPQKDLSMIQCFGGFEVRNSEGVPVHFRTRRAEELFAYFLCHSGRNISKWQVMDLLWPDMPEERSSSNLYNTIYLMKKILKENELGMSIRKMNDGYMMETGNQMYDALAFNAQMSLLPRGSWIGSKWSIYVRCIKGRCWMGKPIYGKYHWRKLILNNTPR